MVDIHPDVIHPLASELTSQHRHKKVVSEHLTYLRPARLLQAVRMFLWRSFSPSSSFVTLGCRSRVSVGQPSRRTSRDLHATGSDGQGEAAGPT